MMAVFWAEIGGWCTEHARRTVWSVVFPLAAVGYLIGQQPEYNLLLLTAIALWFACFTGERGWSGTRCVDWIKQAGLGPWQVAAGRMAAALVVVLFIHFFALPGMVLMAAMWGVPYTVLGQAALTAAVGALTAAGLGLAGSMLTGDEDTYTGKFITAMWLFMSYAVPRLHVVNPIKQIWTLMTRREYGFPFAGLMAGLCLAAFTCLVDGLLLKWEAGRN